VPSSTFARIHRPTLLSDLPLAIGFMLLVCSALSAVWLFREQRQADELVRHTMTVESQLSQVQIEGLKAAVDVRTSVLAEAAGRDPGLPTVRARYFAHVDELRGLTADNPSQQRRIAELRSISTYRFAVLDHAVAEWQAGRFRVAAQLITAPRMQDIIDRARREMDGIRAEEVRLLQQRSARSDEIRRLGSWSLSVSLALVFLLAVIVLPERRARIHALWSTKRALEAAVEAKRSFLANMSHEIRTPMNGVLGFTELLLAGELSDEQRRRAELIDTSGRAMMRLLNDILDFSKIEAGHVVIAHDPFDLPHALGSCLKLVAPAAERKSLALNPDFDADLPKMMLGDGLRLRQIVLNLLGNAIKFTEEGAVTLRAYAAGEELVLEVEDTGIGIGADRHQAIFEEFVQADSAIAPRFGGTGLGLSITMQLVRLMGGTIELDSAPGAGSTFRITLPLEAAPEAALPAPEMASPAKRPVARDQRILLAEDHDVNQQLFMGMLDQLGWNADLASDGAEAIAMVEQAERDGKPYRLLLMDMQMPGVDGLEATRRIRAGGLDSARLPILAVTANAYEADVAACFAAGCQAHLAKPVQLADLDRAIRKWLANAPAKPAFRAITGPVRDLYEKRKTETLEAVDELVGRGHLTDDEIASVADLLHKLAGTAAMFGEPDLGHLARDLEVGITRWTGEERQAKLRAAAAAIWKAA
jgi:signal transduction histidine kinase/DNA-binding response OmpR family regulator